MAHDRRARETQKALRRILETQYRHDAEWAERNQAEAEEARRNGDVEGYLTLARHGRLPDTCWALELWDEARSAYRHNAAVLTERRGLLERSDPEELIDELIDEEAATLVKAGHLERGRVCLERAMDHFGDDPDWEVIRAELGLYAAQAGRRDLARHAGEALEARAELSEQSSREARLVVGSLQYESAQAAVLLGDWERAREELERAARVQEIVEQRPGRAFDPSLEEAIAAALRGLSELALLRERRGDAGSARAHFEAAMLAFYRFEDSTDVNTYFLRLNTRLADDLAAGREPDPNPFAEREER